MHGRPAQGRPGHQAVVDGARRASRTSSWPRPWPASRWRCSTAILQKAGPTLNYGTFAAAGNSLGKIVLPTFPDAWNFGAPPNADGNPKVYFFKWNPTTDQYDILKS